MKKQLFIKKILDNPKKLLAKAIEADENTPLPEEAIADTSKTIVEDETDEPPVTNDDRIHQDIEEEFRQLEQPEETIPPHETKRIEVPFSVLRKLGEGKKLDNILNGTTACGDGKSFTEPIGGNDEDDYGLTIMNQE